MVPTPARIRNLIQLEQASQLQAQARQEDVEESSTKCTCCSTKGQYKRSSSKVGDGLLVNDNQQKKTKNNNLLLKRRRVQFFPKCTVKTTISLHDMTDNEIQATWIQQKEGDAIKRRCQKLIAAEYKNKNHTGRHEMRGLENIKQRRSNRYIAKEEVFDEQDLQGFDYDDEKLAFVYKTFTMKSSVDAIQMAIKDRNDIEQYLLKQ